ncbi:MAG: 5-formyltetrahydrofolate cyclo-ligase [Coriobacteriia bacterium]|nr:5-formyltetrahydrofolate cyclo-ligase [Coriobacteriia bacterium]
MESKRELRARMRALRESLDAATRSQADARVAWLVTGHPAYLRAETIFTYVSVGTEVDTRAIIRDAWVRGKTVAAPRVVPGTRTMEWYAITDFESLETSPFGVEEPVANPGYRVAVSGGEGASAIALVPGFTFDSQGYRVGYGGGFYDAFLPTFGGFTLGLCREAQMSATAVPRDAHDVPVNEVIAG